MGLGARAPQRAARRHPAVARSRAARRDCSTRIRTPATRGCSARASSQPNTSYTAFVVPAFEVGRRAGLGEAIADTDDGTHALVGWRRRRVSRSTSSGRSAPASRATSNRWCARSCRATWTRGSASATCDIAQPGFGVDAVSNPPDDLVGLEGALLAPTTVRQARSQPASDFVAEGRSRVLNAPADGARRPAAAIRSSRRRSTAAGTRGRARRAPRRRTPGWVDALNLDPRYRAAAGLGARVIRANQERYMRSAWEQIGDVLAVNQKIRRAQLATKAASAAYVEVVRRLPPERRWRSPRRSSQDPGQPDDAAALMKASRLPRAALSPRSASCCGRAAGWRASCFARQARAGATGTGRRRVDARRLSAAPPLRPPAGATLGSARATPSPGWPASGVEASSLTAVSAHPLRRRCAPGGRVCARRLRSWRARLRNRHSRS